MPVGVDEWVKLFIYIAVSQSLAFADLHSYYIIILYYHDSLYAAFPDTHWF